MRIGTFQPGICICLFSTTVVMMRNDIPDGSFAFSVRERASSVPIP